MPDADADVVITSRTLESLAQTQADIQAVGRQALLCVKGRIVNVGSGTSLFGMPGIVPYCASRGGITQMTKALAAEWALDGITVNVLLPP